MTNKREVAFVLRQHLEHLRTRWLAHANEAETYKNLYEEANLFVQRAIQRLSEDHPLHPFNYNQLFSDDYARQLAAEFEAQDAESNVDPELEGVVGIDEAPVEDEMILGGEHFNISDYNKSLLENANKATTGKVLVPDEEVRDKLEEQGYNPYVKEEDAEEVVQQVKRGNVSKLTDQYKETEVEDESSGSD